MKKLSAVLILVLVLTLSALLLCSCNILGIQFPSGTNPTDTDTHAHTYQYTLVNNDGIFALEGICVVENCNKTVYVDEGLVPEYTHVAPTCTQSGSSVWSCTKDGVKYELKVTLEPNENNHSYSNGVCQYCGAQNPEYTPDNPEQPEHTHTWTDATCTTPKVCSGCGTTEGSAKGHQWNNATCTTPKTCGTCGTTSGTALGHSWNNATCTTPKTCGTCGTTSGTALGHSWNNATCTLPKTCGTCGTTMGTPNGHSFSNGSCLVCGADDPDYVEPEHNHTDANNDDECDTCFESVLVVLDFYVINDLHGKFCDTDSQPGVDNLATYLKDRQNYDDNVIIFSSGDMWQGAAESNLTNGLILTEWMNELNFVSMTLGNHEYDWGEDAIRENLAVAEFPFLAINIYDKTTGKLADYCTPSVVVECDGIKVGIIGAIGDCYSSISSDMVSNVEFKVGSELTALVKAESNRLRAEGVDLVVYSLHDGYGSSSSSVGSVSSSGISSYYDTALSNGYVDVVFEGHTHQSYTLYDNYDVYHMQGGGENKGITHVEISLNFVNGTKKVSEAEVVKNSTYSIYAEDDATEAIEDKYADVIDKAYAVIGNVSTKQSSTTLKNIMAELYLEVGLERWGDKYDIVLGGGYISTRSPYDLSAGQVTYSDVLSLFPFDNQIVLCSISGKYLSSAFVNTSNTNYYNAYSTYGESVKNNISSSKTYYVVVDMYSALYTYNHLTIVDYYDEGVYARDLLAEEIKAGRFDTSGGNNGGNNSGNTSGYTLTSIPDVIAKGKTLGSGGKTEENYYVKGTIKSISNTTYGNMYIEDEDGNQLLIYGLYDSNGNKYGSMSTKPQVGDTIVVCGPILYYNGTTVEIKDGVLIATE